MVTEPSLWGSMSPGFKPFLRAEPGGRRVGGWNQALKPQVLHPTSCDGFLAAAALRRGRGESGGGGRGSSRLGSLGIWSFHSSFVGRGRVARLPFPPCHAGWLHLACRGPRCCRFPLAGFEASPRASRASFLGAGRPAWPLWPCQRRCPSWTAQLRPLHPLLSVGTTCVCDGPSPGVGCGVCACDCVCAKPPAWEDKEETTEAFSHSFTRPLCLVLGERAYLQGPLG